VLGGLRAARARDGELQCREPHRPRRPRQVLGPTGRRLAAGVEAPGEVVEHRRELVEPAARLLGPCGDGLDDGQQPLRGVGDGGLHRGAILSQQPLRIVDFMSPFWIWTQAFIVLFVVIGIVIAIVKLV
jgi:hypothetical protein